MADEIQETTVNGIPISEMGDTPRNHFAALQRHFREQAVRCDGLEKTHKAWGPIVLEELPRLKRELEETKHRLAERNSLFHTVAVERDNLTREIEARAAAGREANARAEDAERRMAEMLDHPDVKAAELARAQAALAEAQAKVAALTTAPA